MPILMKVTKMNIQNVEKEIDRRTAITRLAFRAISDNSGGAWQQVLLEKLKRGPQEIWSLNPEIIIGASADGVYLEIKAYLSLEKRFSLIQELREEGCLVVKDCILTGRGPYAPVPLTKLEKEVLEAVDSDFSEKITATRIHSKMKRKKVNIKQVERAMDSLVEKGYVEKA
jgi:hypothetical protein